LGNLLIGPSVLKRAEGPRAPSAFIAGEPLEKVPPYKP